LIGANTGTPQRHTGTRHDRDYSTEQETAEEYFLQEMVHAAGHFLPECEKHIQTIYFIIVWLHFALYEQEKGIQAL